MKVRWDVDGANSVVLNIGMFGSKVLVNGSAMPVKINLNKMNYLPFALADGRDALIAVTPRIATRPGFTLTVSGAEVEEIPRSPILCGACDKRVKAGERFCGACGHELPPPEYYRHKLNVKTATQTIGWLALVYLAAGAVLFLMAIPQHNYELKEVAGMAPDEVVPRAINGVTYTVAQYREKLFWESSSIAVVCLALSAIMGLLAWWGRRTPLPPLLIVSVFFVCLAALNLVLSAGNPGNMLVYQALVIIFLVRGVKSALALRTAKG